MLATIAAATTTLLAACGGGSADADGGANAAAAAAVAPAATPAQAGTVHSVEAPAIADQGPIAAHLMGADAQDELRAAAQDTKPAPDAAATAKPAREGDTAASPASAVTPAAAPSPNGATATGTRSGGRAVPLPSVSAPAPAPSPTVSSPTAPATTTTTTTTTTDGTQTSGAQVLQPVSSTDIRLQVEPGRLFSSYKWMWSAECAGYKEGAVNIAESGLHSFDLGSGLGTQRFGRVPDPDDASRRVLMFRPNAGDPWIYGGPRCEMTFSPTFGGKLPVKQDVWFAFGMRFQDWTSSTDEQVLMQWHWSNGSIPIGPFLALAMKGGKLQIDSKANAAYPPAAATTTSTVHWNGDVKPNTWSYFVVKARISPNPADAPYLQVWRDGTQIVNHQGPLGYNYPEVTPYVKVGHYQWIASYNTWAASAATKTVLVRTPALINDTTGKYTEADIRGHVKAR
jgi:hypothetical protein